MSTTKPVTTDEMRCAIARAKGWSAWFTGRGYDMPLPPDLLATTFRVVKGFDNPSALRWRASDPDWSTDLNAARDLMDEMQPDFFRIAIYQWDHTRRTIVECDPRHGHAEIVPPIIGEGETICMAIGDAYLTWKKTK